MLKKKTNCTYIFSVWEKTDLNCENGNILGVYLYTLCMSIYEKNSANFGRALVNGSHTICRLLTESFLTNPSMFYYVQSVQLYEKSV